MGYLTKLQSLFILLCMGTKTLSVDEEAYGRLVAARTSAKESFSKVIKRASWENGPKTAAGLLARASGYLEEDIPDALDRAQVADAAPEDPWKE